MALDGRGDEDEQLPIRRLSILPYRQNTEEPQNGALQFSDNSLDSPARAKDVQEEGVAETEQPSPTAINAKAHFLIGEIPKNSQEEETQRTTHYDPTSSPTSII
jgi:hypothetical protein